VRLYVLEALPGLRTAKGPRPLGLRAEHLLLAKSGVTATAVLGPATNREVPSTRCGGKVAHAFWNATKPGPLAPVAYVTVTTDESNAFSPGVTLSV